MKKSTKERRRENKMTKEQEKISNDEYNKWYNAACEKLGCLLINAFIVSMDTGDIYKMGTIIENWIKEMNLPIQKCSGCGVEMSFFDYHLRQGICDSCATKIEKETYEEDE